MNNTAESVSRYSTLDGFQIIEPELNQDIFANQANLAKALARRQEHAPIRVLLAEDDPDTSMLMSYVLEEVGMEVTRANDGGEALQFALWAKNIGSEFDVILMDVQMPVLDGYNVTWELRHSGYVGPIVAMTGKALEEDKDFHLEAGCNYFLCKSDVSTQLAPIIAKCILKGGHSH